jgi:hypothetical protein
VGLEGALVRRKKIATAIMAKLAQIAPNAATRAPSVGSVVGIVSWAEMPKGSKGTDLRRSAGSEPTPWLLSALTCPRMAALAICRFIVGVVVL